MEPRATRSDIIVTTLASSGHTASDVRGLLEDLDAEFDPPISSMVDLAIYAEKLSDLACVVLARHGDRIAGLAAIYVNDLKTRTSYIPVLGVRPDYRGCGLARRIILECLAQARTAGMRRVRVRTWQTNAGALRLYRALGFEAISVADDRGTGIMSIMFEYAIR